MPHRKCSFCGEDIVLFPSATARAKKLGESPEFYKSLFKMHSHCEVKNRNQQVLELLRRNKCSS